jgi:hypothetical protein
MSSMPHLNQFNQWILWKWSSKKGQKATKIPVDPNSKTLRFCNAQDPMFWMSFADMGAARERALIERGEKLHPGFVLTESDPFVCIDLDGCRKARHGLVWPWAQDIVNQLHSYTEVSPSRTGLKIFVRTSDPSNFRVSKKLPVERLCAKTPAIEVFSSRQFVAITGQRHQFDAIEDRTETVRQFIQEYGPSKVQSEAVREFRDNPDADAQTVADARGFLSTFPAAVSGNGGHNTTFAAACRLMIDYALSSVQALELLQEWNGTCDPPWDLHELRHKIEGAGQQSGVRGIRTRTGLDNELKNAGILWNTNSTDTNLFEPLGASVNIGSFDSDLCNNWPELESFSSDKVESMTGEDFPPVASSIITAVAESTETPVELPGLIALGVLATTCQRKFEISLPDGHIEPLCLWVCPAMGPGNRKTTVFKTLTSPLRQWESDQRRRLAPVIKNQESARLTIEKQIDRLRNNAGKKEGQSDHQMLIQQIQQLEEELPVAESYPTLFTDDCTPEQLPKLLSQNKECIAILSDEGGIFDLIEGRYSRGVPNLDTYLKGHAGSSKRVHRGGDQEPIDLQAPCVTFAVSPQPSVLVKLASNKMMLNRGFFERFLFAIPESLLGYRTLDPRPIPERLLSEWNDLIRNILDLPFDVNHCGELQPKTLTLTTEAYHLWKQEQLRTEDEMRPGNTWFDNPGWASKYPGAVLRIAGIFHVAATVTSGSQIESRQVDFETMTYAVRIGRKIKDHTLRTFGQLTMNSSEHLARKIATWLKSHGHTKASERDMKRGVCLPSGQDECFKNSVEILISAGWIRSMKSPPRTGRPSIQYDVNPRVLHER